MAISAKSSQHGSCRLFDGSLSESGLKHSQFHQQPVNFWFRDVQPPDHHMDTTSDNRTAQQQQVTTDAPYRDNRGSLLASDQPDAPYRDKNKSRGSLLASDQPDGRTGSCLDDLPGAGTIIAVLDTGIVHDHLAFSSLYQEVEFDEKVVECKNFISADDCEDYNGHGTQCAGVACGLTFVGQEEGDERGTTYAFNSAAPGARLMVCKVGHNEMDDEDASLRAINGALDYIIAHNEKPENLHRRVDVVSLSFGFDYFSEELAMKVQEAVSKHIIVV